LIETEIEETIREQLLFVMNYVDFVMNRHKTVEFDDGKL